MGPASYMRSVIDRNAFIRHMTVIIRCKATVKFTAFFKTCCIISVLFSTKCCLFHNFIFVWSSNAHFINHMLKFQHQPSSGIKVNICAYRKVVFEPYAGRFILTV
jgi:hypothetical protein